MYKGNSHKNNCPTPLKKLKYINLEYINFDGETKIGELIVHESVSMEIVDIFKSLYKIKYPISKMELVSNYKGNDFDSIEANNTSAYNCRAIAGTNRWSRHAFGKAIDINPLENPFVSKKGNISHKDSLKFRKRFRQNPFDVRQNAMILKKDKIVKMFKSYGWIWGGDWITIKDYQHFDKRK